MAHHLTATAFAARLVAMSGQHVPLRGGPSASLPADVRSIRKLTGTGVYGWDSTQTLREAFLKRYCEGSSLITLPPGSSSNDYLRIPNLLWNYGAWLVDKHGLRTRYNVRKLAGPPTPKGSQTTDASST